MGPAMLTDPLRLSIAPPHVWQETPMPDGGPPLAEDAAMPIAGRLTFRDVLRGLNPLHHLPVLGSIYRAATGEEVPAPMRVLGGALFGGPIGMLIAAATLAVEQFQPVQRLRLSLEGRPDPFLDPPPADPPRLAATPAEALAAYRRWTGVPPPPGAVA
ncbi:MAG: hypothetical protein N2588_02045 [Rhodovarius sp.]|nr:hypothetical protein [Rhodovarius sp.]